MADGSAIEWTDATWQPITGCSIVSPGCTNCYAMKLAGTRLRHHPSRQGLTIDSKAGPVWNGEVRFNEQWLMQPLAWRKPRKVFVCAHGDLFHESIPDEWIDRVFAVMALAPQHTFQVLTKRADRMREYLSIRNGMGNGAICRAINLIPNGLGNRHGALSMPLPNVWLGVSTERQQEADERIPLLAQTPAAVRFISAEPLLGPIDLTSIVFDRRYGTGLLNALTGEKRGHVLNSALGSTGRLDWVIAGGESGPNSRPMHPDWARRLRDDCKAAGVPFFFKQWGVWGPDVGYTGDGTGPDLIFEGKGPCAKFVGDRWEFSENGFTMPLGGDHQWMYRLGKKAAGRLLDGVEHNAMPEIAR